MLQQCGSPTHDFDSSSPHGDPVHSWNHLTHGEWRVTTIFLSREMNDKSYSDVYLEGRKIEKKNYRDEITKLTSLRWNFVISVPQRPDEAQLNFSNLTLILIKKHPIEVSYRIYIRVVQKHNPASGYVWTKGKYMVDS